MNLQKIRYISIITGFVSLLFVYSACDGIFPSQSKSFLPADHTNRAGGFLHAPIERNSSGQECEECHGSDLRGGLYNFNGTIVVTQSCYQCHGNIWNEGGNGGN
jgi:hypothetical protein